MLILPQERRAPASLRDSAISKENAGPGSSYARAIHSLADIVIPQRLAILLNFDIDDSYTPTKLLIRAGTGLHDLQEIKSVSMEQPRGWIQFDVGTEPDGDEDSTQMCGLEF